MRGAVLFAAGLSALALGGCAAPSATPRLPSTSLRIDGRPPTALLAPGEPGRIASHIPAEYRGAVLAAEALGAVIYHHHHLATVAAGLLGQRAPSDFSAEVAGWLGERAEGRLRVLFLVHGKHGPAVAAVARARSGTGAVQLAWKRPPRALTPQEVVLWRARQLAFSASITPCAKRYEPVVVPLHAEGIDQIYVYLLPVSAKRDRIFLGGFYRIAISADGDRILATHAFTHACLALRRRRATVAASVTEIRSNTPTPVQVYASLHYRLPVYVATAGNRLEWKVDRGQVSLIGPIGSR